MLKLGLIYAFLMRQGMLVLHTLQAIVYPQPATSRHSPHRMIQSSLNNLNGYSFRMWRSEIHSLQKLCVPVEADEETAGIKRGITHSSSHEYGPWRLNGTTLSIDIRKAGCIPVTVGYSTYQVVDGRLFQTITLDQGDISIPVIIEGVKPHGRRMTKAIKSDDVAASPSAPHCRPLSLKQKRRLVGLREGHIWNDIAGRFPGRKKGTLQRIYYAELKRFGNQISEAHLRSKRRPFAADDRARSPETGNVPLPAEKPAGCQRYSLRARRATQP
ncbi:hypothetical protein MAP00_006513 [Monascus purpureus]|nr:hypothetical protein MAP00_006513 [Monascus purpureus]